MEIDFCLIKTDRTNHFKKFGLVKFELNVTEYLMKLSKRHTKLLAQLKSLQCTSTKKKNHICLISRQIYI